MKRSMALTLVLLALIGFSGAYANAAPLPAAGTGNQVDLFAGLDLNSAKLAGDWEMNGGALISKGAPAAILLAPEPRGAYELTVVYQRFEDNDDTPAIYLPVGAHTAVLQARSNLMGLDQIAGKRYYDDNNPTVRKGNYGGEAQHTITARVVPSGNNVTYTISFDGHSEIEWSGPQSQVSLSGYWKVPSPHRIIIGSWGGSMRFWSARLQGLGGTSVTSNNNPGSPKNEPAPTPPSNAPPVTAVRSSAPTDVTVASAQPEAGAAALPPGPTDPSAIERPEYRTRPKPLMKSLTSITSMMVLIHEDGDETGVVDDIIAVVPPESRRQNRSGVGFVLPDGDDSMKVAFNEAVRAVTLRYPVWEPGHIDISFGEKFIGHGGPSAGCAFGLLMLSTLEGFELDPKCAVTGDITVDWKVRQVGGVAAKLHGAAIEKCELAVIPAKDSMAFQDMALLYDISALWDVQVFGAETLQDEVAVARKDRPKELHEAIEMFADLRGKLRQPGKAISVLHQPTTKETLNRILELAPNHLSAKFLLEIANNSAPRSLSVNASLYRLGVAFYPFERIIFGKEPLTRNTLPASVTNIGRKRLAALRPITDKSILPLVNDVAAFIGAMDSFAGSPNEKSFGNLMTRAQAVDGRFAAIRGDSVLVDRIVHEGY
jgi:hypothetical protein